MHEHIDPIKIGGELRLKIFELALITRGKEVLLFYIVAYCVHFTAPQMNVKEVLHILILH